VVIGVLMVLPMWGWISLQPWLGRAVWWSRLALQDSLSDLFSGMSLVIEAAYRTGDLLQLATEASVRWKKWGCAPPHVFLEFTLHALHAE
jgi:small-conductance mechanosensitive channel